MNCMVCDKHENFLKFTGEPVAQGHGFAVSHFPIIDGQPANRGHLLIESSRHVVEMDELSDKEASALGLLIRDSVKAVKSILGAEHAYVLRINDKVKHLHLHVVPRYPGTPPEAWGPKLMEWSGFPKVSLGEAQEISRRLKEAMCR